MAVARSSSKSDACSCHGTDPGAGSLFAASSDSSCAFVSRSASGGCGAVRGVGVSGGLGGRGGVVGLVVGLVVVLLVLLPLLLRLPLLVVLLRMRV